MSFELTAEQVEAVKAPASSQLLVAGAGAGKTTVMARRILHLVTVRPGARRPDPRAHLHQQGGPHLKPSGAGVLAADADVTVGTYHSFGASLVADHALELDLHPDTRILNRAQAWQLLFAVFDEFRFERRKTLSPEGLLIDALDLASRCADHLVPSRRVADCDASSRPAAAGSDVDTAAAAWSCARWWRPTRGASGSATCSTSATRSRWPSGS